MSLIHLALACKCPRCGKGDLYKPGWSLILNDQCPSCNLDLAANDSADGPAVFLIFILGFGLTLTAVLFDFLFHPPLWVHAILWSVVGIGVTVLSLKPLKAYIIALQYKHRPGTWENK